MKIRNYEYVNHNYLIAEKADGTRNERREIGRDEQGRQLFKDYPVSVTNTEKIAVSHLLTPETYVDLSRDGAGRLIVGSGYRAPSGASQRNQVYYALAAIALESRGYWQSAPTADEYVTVELDRLNAALGFDTAEHLTALSGEGLIVSLGSWDSPKVTRFRLPFGNGLLTKVYETRHVNGAAPTKAVDTTVDLGDGVYRYNRTKEDLPFDSSGSAFTTAINGAMA